jgi:hypothetical protein
MSNLEEYVNGVKQYISQQNNMTETEKIRYVYLDLGKRLSFNEKFLPFGSSKEKQIVYKYHSKSISDLDECMESNKAICKSISYILEYVLKKLDVDIKTEVDRNDIRKCPHTYNVIKPKERESYIVDLQEDMYNIQSHSFTKNFGISLKNEKNYVISRFEQEQMDRKNGYIDDENYYADDYLYLLKYDTNFMEDFDEKARFILENIDIYDNPNMGYTDRQWHHKTILEEFFNNKEFDYQDNSGKIKIVDCYKDINGERNYVNCIALQAKTGTEMYVYNKKEYRYCKMDLMNFAQAVQNGLVIYNCNVPGLKKALRELKANEELKNSKSNKEVKDSEENEER